MNNDIKNLLGGIVLFFVGTLLLLIRNKFNKIPPQNQEDYYTRDQIKNKKLIGGIFFISIGSLVIIYYLAKIFKL